ncbi:MAG: phosphate acyltransferase [Actinomycetota bacterium]|jgi:glycerol-3-phosphate acyltransferase PlsX|nr:phosphate acyltransferase [Actinomycetota bacterium]
MGGDKGPAEIIAGARQAAEELGVPVVLVGQPEAIGDAGGLEVLPAGEVIGMTDDPAQGVRRKKDASVVRAAEAVRDGKASAMVSAGNTGAAMASALLRMGRISRVQRPAIASVLPVPGSTPTILLDAGANVDCNPAMLVQFAQMGAVYAAARWHLDSPRVALLSNGEEDGKGNILVKEAHALLADPGCLRAAGTFIGNVEGRDLLSDRVDVVVCDGFIGNVVLKTLEGALRFLVDSFLRVMTSTEEGQRATEQVLPLILPLHAELDPDSYGGAMLLGVDGVCIISHGSSSTRAIFNAVGLAREMVEAGMVGRVGEAVSPSKEPAAG